MTSTTTLPMMLPLRMRNRTELDSLRAQEQYAPFRSTPFGHASLDEGANDGPGALFRDEWNSVAARAQAKNFSLYKKDREVNPTIPPAVDAAYNAYEATDVALQMSKKGNIAPMLKSPTPRFQQEADARRVGPSSGPGAYTSERFTGAFPILSEHITPLTVREEKKRAHQNFEKAFAILPSASKSPRIVEPSGSRNGVPGKLSARLRSSSSGSASTSSNSPDDTDPVEWQGLHSTPLKPALTPRNAYSDRANRELVLQRTKT